MEALFQEVGYQSDTATAEAQRVMSEVDKDQDGHISLEEFGIVWQRKLLAVNEQYIKAVFGVLGKYFTLFWSSRISKVVKSFLKETEK